MMKQKRKQDERIIIGQRKAGKTYREITREHGFSTHVIMMAISRFKEAGNIKHARDNHLTCNCRTCQLFIERNGHIHKGNDCPCTLINEDA